MLFYRLSGPMRKSTGYVNQYTNTVNLEVKLRLVVNREGLAKVRDIHTRKVVPEELPGLEIIRYNSAENDNPFCKILFDIFSLLINDRNSITFQFYQTSE